jgi:hypothetical protein
MAKKKKTKGIVTKQGANALPEDYRGIRTNGSFLEYASMAAPWNFLRKEADQRKVMGPSGHGAQLITKKDLLKNAEKRGNKKRAAQLKKEIKVLDDELSSVPMLGENYAEVDAFSGADVPEFGLGGILAGAGQGALSGGMTGAAAGGIGALPGALIGGAMGLVGGLAGHFGEKNALEQQKDLLTRQEALKSSHERYLELTADPTAGAGMTQVANQYAPTFACGGKVKKMPKGGMVDSRLVELEDGEPFKSPDGTIGVTKTSAPSHKKGGVPLNLEVGTKVLGKKIDKETGMSYKDYGRKLSALKQKHQKTLDEGKGSKFARNAAKAMINKVDTKFDEAFERQEKGKPKVKTAGIPKASGGIKVGGRNPIPRYDDARFGNIGQTPTLDFYALQGLSMGNQLPYAGGMAPHQDFTPTWDRTSLGNFGGLSAVDTLGMTPYGSGISSTTAATAGPVATPGNTGIQQSMFDKKNNQYQGFNFAGSSLVGGPSAAPDINLQNAVGDTNFGTPGYQPKDPKFGFLANVGQALGNVNWGKILGGAAALAPVGYNLIQGMKPAEQLEASDYYNPQYGQAIDLMANRRFDVDPLLEANRTAQAVGNYNVRSMAGGLGAGAVASNQLANTAQRMRADQAAYAQKQNMDNQYLGQEAQMRATLGAGRASTNYQVAQDNLAAEAARRAHLGAGFSGLSQFAQTQQLMGGQRQADQQRLQILQGMEPMFRKWFGNLNTENNGH